MWLVTVACVVVGSLLPSTSPPIRVLDELKLNDKMLHFAAYLMLMLLPALHETRLVTGLLALAVASLGLVLEYGQGHVIGRSFELGDLVANTAGVVCGLVAAKLFRPKVTALLYLRSSELMQADLMHAAGELRGRSSPDRGLAQAPPGLG